jgi:hypothetical protein
MSWLLLLTACGAHITGSTDNNSTGDVTPDAGELPDGAEPIDAAVEPDAPLIDAPPVLGPWAPPQVVTVAATAGSEDDGTLSSNALEMIFSLQNASAGNKQLYYTSRPSLTGAWTSPTRLPFNSNGSDQTPRFAGDDKTLYFASSRAGNGDLDVYMVTRATAGVNSWGTPTAVAGVSRTGADDKWFAPCDGGRYVVVRDRNGDTDLFEGVLGQGTPTAIGTLNTTFTETSAFLTQDCLTIYFASTRVAPQNLSRLFTAHRATAASPWPAPTQVTDFKIGAGTDNQEDPWLAPDGRTFALSSDASGSRDVYLSTR